MIDKIFFSVCVRVMKSGILCLVFGFFAMSIGCKTGVIYTLYVIVLSYYFLWPLFLSFSRYKVKDNLPPEVNMKKEKTYDRDLIEIQEIMNEYDIEQKKEKTIVNENHILIERHKERLKNLYKEDVEKKEAKEHEYDPKIIHAAGLINQWCNEFDYKNNNISDYIPDYIPVSWEFYDILNEIYNNYENRELIKSVLLVDYYFVKFLFKALSFKRIEVNDGVYIVSINALPQKYGITCKDSAKKGDVYYSCKPYSGLHYSFNTGERDVTLYLPDVCKVTFLNDVDENTSFEKEMGFIRVETTDSAINEAYKYKEEKERREIIEEQKAILKKKMIKREAQKIALVELEEEGYVFPEQQRRPPIPNEIKDFVWNRDGGRCVECGSRENLQFDHIIPFSKGGATTAENLQILCQKCNLRKSNHIG